MEETAICYRPVGIARTPFTRVEGMPIQPPGALGVAGRIEVAPEYAPGLKDLDGFSHLILIYHLHRIQGFSLSVTPFLDNAEHGIFATRSPKRPNALGLSVVRLTRVSGAVVYVENVDMLDGTPILDIKPYVKDFDVWDADRFGWFEGRSAGAATCRSDARFAAEDTEPGATPACDPDKGEAA